MNNFGVKKLVLGTPLQFLTGVSWEYLSIVNESPYMLSADFSGMSSMNIPAWYKEDIQVPRGYTGSLIVTAIDLTPSESTKAPSFSVTVNGYIPGELKAPHSTALTGRTTNVGNNVTTAQTTQVINDGQPASTVVVEATVLGSTGSNVKILNQGDLTIAEYFSAVLTPLLKVITAAGFGSVCIQLGRPNKTTEVMGALQLDDVVQFSANAAQSIAAQTGVVMFSSTDGNDLVLRAPGAGFSISFYVNNNTRLMRMDSNGNLILKGTLTQNGAP